MSFVYRLPNISTILYDLKVPRSKYFYVEICPKNLYVSKFLLALKVSIQTKKSFRTKKNSKFWGFKAIFFVQINRFNAIDSIDVRNKCRPKEFQCQSLP